VTKNTTFLTGFSALLCGRSKSSMQSILSKKRRQLLKEGIDLQNQFLDEIDPELLESFSATQRVRSYPDPLVFWAFLYQVSSDDPSCANAVSRIQEWASAQDLPVPSAGTSSYCKARSALPVEMLKAVQRSLCDQLDRNLPDAFRWRGLRPLAEDGTTAQMPDTDANREARPYPSGQAEGCGFPVVRLGGLIDLSHGGIRDFAHSNLDTSELQGHKKLQEGHLGEGDVLVADRLFSGYELIAGLRESGVHFIGRTHHARKVDFRRGRKIAPDQRLVSWKKPRQAPKGSRLDPEQWDALPETLEVRIIRCKGPDRQGRTKVRYVVTTLLDHEAFPAEEVASLYVHRWEIELRFRDIKTTLGMEMLRTKSPELIIKEILMHMIFYNLVRLLMLKAGVIHGVNHRRLSFRGTQQVIHACRESFAGLGIKPRLRRLRGTEMWRRIAERIVIERPGRNEPRRVKRRPKCTRWLQKPRHQYFEHFRSDDPPAKILDCAA
jgi:hypothetical protein